MCHQMPVDVESFHIAGSQPRSDSILAIVMTSTEGASIRDKLIKFNDKIAGLQFSHITERQIFWELDKLYEELKQIIKEV